MKKFTLILVVALMASTLTFVSDTPTAEAHVSHKHCEGRERQVGSNAMAFQIEVKKGKHVDCQYRGVMGCHLDWYGYTYTTWVTSKDYVKKKKGLSKWRVLACPFGFNRMGGPSFYISWNAGYNGEFNVGEEA